MKNIYIAIGLFFLAGCSTPMPTPEQISTSDCGPSPDNFTEWEKSYILAQLKDPGSAEFRNFTKPVKDCIRDAPIAGGKLHYGWLVSVDVNAENEYGGYVGFETYSFIFRGYKVIAVRQPPDEIWHLLN
jgi:hypothetical protein